MNPPKLIFLLILTITLYLLMIFITIPEVTKYSAGMDIFDMMPLGYDMQYARKLLDILGSKGRDIYLHKQLPLDFIYSGLFMITYTSILFRIYDILLKNKKIVYFISSLAIIGGLSDYLENILIVRMLKDYPQIGNLPLYSNIFTITKSFLSSSTFMLIMIGLLIIFFRRKKKRPV